MNLPASANCGQHRIRPSTARAAREAAWVAVVALILISPVLAGAAEDFQSRLIFLPQAKHVHSSSIVELPNGDLLAVWFHGSGERSANDVVIQGARLTRGAKSWSEVFTAADTPGWPDCNPIVFLDGQQRLRLMWLAVQANRWDQSLLKYRLTTDYASGPPRWQWQDVLLLRPDADFAEQLRAGFKALGYNQSMWAEYARPYDELLVEAAADPAKRETGWMTRAKPLRLARGPHTGRWLLPLYSDGFNISLMAISDDECENWRASKPLVGLGNIQPTLGQRKDGTVVAFMRDGGIAPRRVMVSESKDDGETWTVARDTDLPNPSSSLALVPLADGRWLMALNDTERGRHQMALVLSQDEGHTWPTKKYLDKSTPREASYAYPTMIQSRDGRLHVTYSHSDAAGKSIKHVEFEPDWVTR